MNVEKVKEKARIQMYYQGLNMRLVQIAGDLAKMRASDAILDRKSASEVTEQDASEALYRSMYRAELEKEAAEIRKITGWKE